MALEKRKLSTKQIDSLLGNYEGDNYMQTVALVRQDFKEFKMGLGEVAEACRMNRVSPYDVFVNNRAMANQVTDEILRMRFLGKVHEMGRAK